MAVLSIFKDKDIKDKSLSQTLKNSAKKTKKTISHIMHSYFT